MAQILAHIGLIAWFWFWPGWWHTALLLVAVFAGSCLGGTMTYHRLLSHRSWKCPKALEYLFVVLETFMMTGSAICWVAVHREHHKHSDTNKDPHSPNYKGFFSTHFLSMYAPVKIKYSVDLIKVGFYRFQHEYYFAIVGVYALVLLGVHPILLLTLWLAPSAIVWNLGSLIVSYSHLNCRPKDSFLLGLLTFGEGWHKVHHQKPQKKLLHSFDLGGRCIQAIEWIHRKV